MTWSSPRASGTPPLRRNAHTATAVLRASPVGEQRCDKDVVAEMLILGGSSDQGPVNLDNMDALQVLAGGSLRWRSVSLTGPTPASREMHSATLFESLGAASQGGDDGEGKEGQRGQQGRSGTVCVFAGRGASAVLNDLCLLDLASLTWAGTVASKVQRCAHAATRMGPLGGERDTYMAVFGGWDGGQGVHGNLMVVNLANMMWAESELKGCASPPERFAMASCGAWYPGAEAPWDAALPRGCRGRGGEEGAGGDGEGEGAFAAKVGGVATAGGAGGGKKKKGKKRGGKKQRKKTNRLVGAPVAAAEVLPSSSKVRSLGVLCRCCIGGVCVLGMVCSRVV